MAKAENIPLTRAENLRKNLRRIFDSGVVQQHVAKDAGVHFVHLARILNGSIVNPGLNTAEAIAIAMEIPLETLLAASPSDVDLRILSQKAPVTADST